MQINVAPQVNNLFNTYRKSNTRDEPKKETGLLRRVEPMNQDKNEKNQPIKDVERVCKIIEGRRKELNNANTT